MSQTLFLFNSYHNSVSLVCFQSFYLPSGLWKAYNIEKQICLAYQRTTSLSVRCPWIECHLHERIREVQALLLQSAGLNILNKESSERGSEADSHELDLGTPTRMCTNAYSVIKCNAHLCQPDPLTAFLKAKLCGKLWCGLSLELDPE